MGAAHVNEKNFGDEVLKANTPVLVDFWAEWCGPCKMISPIIDELADELKGKLKVVKLNVDEAQDLSAKFGVMSIPTLLLFKGGQPIEQLVGAMPKDQIVDKVKKHLA
jgi:thioredoxin 1